MSNRLTGFVLAAFVVNLNGGSVGFLAIGKPSFLKINAHGGAPSGTVTEKDGKATGVVQFDLDSLDTGIQLRNHHMKEKYLQTAKYPKAVLTVTEAEVPGGFGTGTFAKEKQPFKGKLQVHGVEKPIEGTFDLKGDPKNTQVAADFEIKISDYGIDKPGYAGVTVADSVKVHVLTGGPIEKKP